MPDTLIKRVATFVGYAIFPIRCFFCLLGFLNAFVFMGLAVFVCIPSLGLLAIRSQLDVFEQINSRVDLRFHVSFDRGGDDFFEIEQKTGQKKERFAA